MCGRVVAGCIWILLSDRLLGLLTTDPKLLTRLQTFKGWLFIFVTACLLYALETNQESGVWGGYAEDERRRLRKRWLADRRRRAS